MSNSNENNLLIALEELLGGPFALEEVPLGDGSTLGWSSTLLTSSGFPLSGGTHHERQIARRIAIAEAFERSLAKRLCQIPKMVEFLQIKESPSCSGFAAGFSFYKTHMRAGFEAVERWAWSQWIDEKKEVPEVPTPENLSEFENFFLKQFGYCRFFERPVGLYQSGDLTKLRFSVFLGFKSGGVFPGSRVSSENDKSWSHPLIESFRNLKNFGPEKQLGSEFDNDFIITKRARYFAENANRAIEQIHQATHANWRIPRFSLWTPIDTHINNVFLSRAICSDHIDWNEGAVERFVY